MAKKSGFKQKIHLSYFIIPTIFVVAGLMLIFSAVSPLLSSVNDIISLFSANDKSDSSLTLSSIYRESWQLNESSVNIKNINFPKYGEHYAMLSIEKAGIVNAKLYFGDSKEILNKGIGQYIGSFIPGYGLPILISGHNTMEFNKLKNVSVNDIVNVKTSYGVYEYKVSDIQIKLAKDKSAFDLSGSKEQLILYTCYPFDTLGLTNKRYFVYTDKVKGPNIVD
jgi:sortase A